MDDYNYIGDYFKGALPAEEMQRFDQKIQEDPAFAEEVAFYCSTMQEIKDQLAEEKKKRFREIYKVADIQKENKTPVILMRRWWIKVGSAAAVVIAVVAGSLWLLQPTAVELADKYIQQNFKTLDVSMGGREDSLQVGLNLYNQGKLKESLVQFESIFKSDTANFNAKKFSGIVSLEMGQYDKALDYFRQLAAEPGYYSNPGIFYQAITLLKRNGPADKQEARTLLEQVVQHDLEGREKAEEWLKKW